MNDPQASEIATALLQVKEGYGINRTNLRHVVTNKIRRWFFPHNLLNARKQKNTTTATYEDKVLSLQDFVRCSTHLRTRWRHCKNSALRTTSFRRTYKNQNFFGSRVSVFSRDPSCWSIGSYGPFLWGSHMQKQYCKRTTLRSKSSTIKGLLYAPDPEKHKKEMLSDQPQLSRVTSTALLCCWGRSCSKIWHPSGLTLRHMPYGRGTLRIPVQRIL